MLALVLVGRYAEVQELDARIVVERVQDVLRFDVAMANALAVKVIASLQQCLEDVSREYFPEAAELLELHSQISPLTKVED